MSLPVVLDSEGLAALSDPRPPFGLQALLNKAAELGRRVLVPAVVCAEVCRGRARTRQVEGVVASPAGQITTGRRAVLVVPTDFDLARQVGAVLHGAAASSADLADAHVVALCVRYGGGLVITSDPDDIHRLAAAVPSVRIVTRSPSR